MIWDAALQALSPYLLLVTLGGVALGIVWGAMPALSTTMAMALLIGLSAGMAQDPAHLLPARGLHRQRVRRRHLGGPDQHPRHARRRADHARGPPARHARRGRPGARYGDRRLVRRQLGRHRPADRLHPPVPPVRAQLQVLGDVPARRDRDLDLRLDDRGRDAAQGLDRGLARHAGGVRRAGRDPRRAALHLRPARAFGRHQLRRGADRPVRPRRDFSRPAAAPAVQHPGGGRPRGAAVPASSRATSRPPSARGSWAQ